MRIVLAFLLFFAAVLPVSAQQDDDGGSALERFLEERLSGAGRAVTITGFQGALSSRATIDELSIADADGVWITLKGAVLDWSRAALLKGRVEVAELSADEIVLTRLPSKGAAPALDQAEAQPFALPDLPVSIQIDRVRTARLELGAAVLGQAAVLQLDGALSLAGGAGQARLVATRSDAAGRFSLAASYANDTRDLALDLALSEAAGGLLSGALDLPGAPPLEATLKGAGPLSAFAAELMLSSAGQQRLTARLTLREPEDAPGTSRFALAASGDLAPLVAPRLRPFFGDSSRLELTGARRGDGGLAVDTLALVTGALRLEGTLALAPTGLPERVALTGRLSGPVALPLAGPETVIGGADLSAQFDAALGQDWQAQAQLAGLTRGGLRLAQATLGGRGTIQPEAPAALSAKVSFDANGLAHDDPALARALGTAITGTADIDWAEGTPLRISALRLTAGRARAQIDATLGTLAEGLTLNGTATVALDDLARLAPLAGRPLGGAAQARVSGRYGLLDGIFDVTLNAATRDLVTGRARLDALLAGPGTLTLAAERGPAGTSLRALEVRTAGLSLTAGGDLSTAAGGLTLTGTVPDLSRIDAGMTGPGTVAANVAWQADGRLRLDRLTATGAGATLQASGAISPADPTLPAEGQLHLQAQALSAFSGLAGRRLSGAMDATLSGRGALRGDFDATLSAKGQGLALGIARLDGVIRGDSSVAVSGARSGGDYVLRALDVTTPQLRLSATDAGGGALDLSGRLADLALVAPGFPGPLSLSGRATPQGEAWQLALEATGPGDTTARIAGSLARNGQTADLSVQGVAPLALANGFIAPRSLDGRARYDLRLRGPLALASLSGQVTTDGGRLSAPKLGLALSDLGGRVDLAGGQARLALTGTLGGGRVELSGPVTLTSPFQGDLSLRLVRAALRDPQLYDTTLDGQLSIAGPLTGGALISGEIALGRTEVLVPSGGAGASGAIPQITHRGAPAAVQATRARAGLTDSRGGGGDGRAYPLNLLISAPSQVFVRGRGLDAELGGRLRLRGTTAAVTPEGQFSLIRGRLDILAKRFTLTEGQIALQGALDPYLRFVAETRDTDVTTQVVIEGSASAPEIRFLSQPELPEEEVVARLLFGRGLETLSAFQALELASAVATLAGGGGGGLVSRLRSGVGLDELDVTTTQDGGTQLRVGKYLTENIYSEVTVDDQGQSQINLNLDLTPSVTVKGQLGAEGDTGVGIFYERDY
ncbi:MAG: translocation/assembly module TamB domain-containing protein [Rhodobacteraceae bacterium]|nr:translocation/assembly module TamB domain-containing protein [Paracoccaceae bacterium]